MTPRWTSNTFAKIHDGCGGLVRWVEAFDDPYTGFTGECLRCSEQGIAVEQIIPIRCGPDRIAVDIWNEVPVETLRTLEWDEDDEWNHNQKRIWQTIEEAIGDAE